MYVLFKASVSLFAQLPVLLTPTRAGAHSAVGFELPEPPLLVMSGPQQTLPREPLPRPILLACASVSLAGLLVGIQLALFSGIVEMPAFVAAMPKPVDDAAKSMVSATFILGTIVFAVPAGPLVDSAGRKGSFAIATALFALSSFAMVRSASIEELAVCRFVAGLAYAVANVVCPMYCAELAPLSWRGVLVSFYQIAITLGIFFIQCVNAHYSQALDWRKPLEISVLPACFTLVCALPFVYESPAWLEAKGRHAEALASARRLRMVWPLPSARDPSAAIDAEEQGSSDADARDRSAAASKLSAGKRPRSFLSMLADSSARRRLVISTGLMVGQQLTGINCIIFFGPTMVGSLLHTSGSQAPFNAAMMLGLANFLASLVSLAVIERAGRRTLLFAAAPPMVLSLVTLGVIHDGVVHAPHAAIIAIMVFITFFALTWGPLPFLVASEIFPVSYKAHAITTSSLIMSVVSLVIAWTFLPLQAGLGGGIYHLFALSMIATTTFVARYVPETRNLSLERIDTLLG